jgi:hypothetical protein
VDILLVVLIVLIALILMGGLFPVANRWPVGYGGGHPVNGALLAVLVLILILIFVK